MSLLDIVTLCSLDEAWVASTQGRVVRSLASVGAGPELVAGRAVTEHLEIRRLAVL
jgi:hypothetical protein